MSALPSSAVETQSLAGSWRVVLDRDDRGVTEQWFARPLASTAFIELPGDLAQRGLGDPVTLETKWVGSIFDPAYFTAPEYAPYRVAGNIKVPFFLQPERYYAGAAWFQRELEIPAAWAGKRVVLSLERAHWETRAWLDGVPLGENAHTLVAHDSLSTPHEYVLGEKLSAGRHVLTLRVDNRYLIPIGPNSHSVTDHTQGNWNGVIGRLELRATEPRWIEELQIYPHVASRSVRVVGRVGGVTKTDANGAVVTSASSTVSTAPEMVRLRTSTGATLELTADQAGKFAVELPLGPEAALWDEFSPALHELTATLANGESRTVRFGLREIATDGTQFTLNGRKIFLRGTLECAIFPRSGHPATDVDEWRRIYRVARAHGLNHVRFHSWCPPEAAFVAADETGFYLQVEVASWPNQGATVGDGRANDAWQIRESDRVLRAYGNHPSFVFLASGNEPAGEHSNAWLTYWLERMKSVDSRRLYASSGGWPELPAGQYQILHQPRMHQWLDHLKSRINALPPETRTDYRDFMAARSMPVVSHEIGQWCVYPNLDEITKYTGYLKPRNFEIFRETLAAHGMADQARAFLHASGKLQALCYKEEIESALRTPGMGGIQLLDLHDFPGQGTALVGVLDAFWEEKGYITPAEFRRFAGPTVPLARLAKRVFTADETLIADIEVTHFGAAPLSKVQPRWKLLARDGATLAEGRLPECEIPIGSATPLGRVEIPLRAVAPVVAIAAKLVVTLPGKDAANDWDVWIYPASPAGVGSGEASAATSTPPSDVLTVNALDDATLAALENGATVFLTIPPERVKPDPKRGRIEIGFSSIFWNTAWTNQQAPHTLGILCDPQHPALAQFPTEAHSNWQWWYPVMRSSALLLDDLPRELQPIVQVIDDWFTNRKLALVIEARVGRGKILVTSIDFTRDDNPVTRQLHTSLLSYVASSKFAPKGTLTRAQLLRL